MDWVRRGGPGCWEAALLQACGLLAAVLARPMRRAVEQAAAHLVVEQAEHIAQREQNLAVVQLKRDVRGLQVEVNNLVPKAVEVGLRGLVLALLARVELRVHAL